MSTENDRLIELPRRNFLRTTAVLSVGAAAAGILAGCTNANASGSMAATGMSENKNAALLNVALGLEYQAIAAYQVGAESGLIKDKKVLDLALQFQGQHKQHAAALKKLVTELNATPVAQKAPLSAPIGKLAAAYGIPAGNLHSQADVLHYAAGLEEGAAKAYLSTVPKFTMPDLAHAAASIEGDEAMHWAVLRGALGLNPVPVAFI
ncbi:ferritin-like domain-containing protein [Acidihalobacter ferrooxydans]|uniref:Ferritin n=1 Tax=Acidihalobacter ferrooxydans TaxID=1765967 RepID=A0A1P8UEV5_9GAMM|nr:ferritin-like domain-containing protein [Acidihalobacter ferrooxydans]APZ42360.1 hypothetical protein BW247_04025 [Acidihalobacter ferrooxydans]